MSNSASQHATTRPWAKNSTRVLQNKANASSAATKRINKKTTVCALECVLCTVRYSQEDILTGLYQITTKVCSNCYARLYAAPFKVSCFGKPDTILLNGTRLKGYSKTANDCQQLCPDRALCARLADPASYNPSK